MLSEEAHYSINFSISNRKYLHYNGSNTFLLVNVTKIYQFKAKNSEIKKYTLCLGNLSGEIFQPIT